VVQGFVDEDQVMVEARYQDVEIWADFLPQGIDYCIEILYDCKLVIQG